MSAASQAEVDDGCAVQRRFFVNDHVGRLQITVEHAVVVDHLERAHQGAADGQSVADGQRPPAKATFKCDAWHKRLDQNQKPIFAAQE